MSERLTPEQLHQRATISAAPFRASHRPTGGLDTATGHLAGREAAIQVLTLPILIAFWALAIAIIAGFIL